MWVVDWSYLIPGFVEAVAPDVDDVDDSAACTVRLGFADSFDVCYGLSLVGPPGGLGEFDEVDEFGTFTTKEAEKLEVVVSVLHGSTQVVDDDPLVAEDNGGVKCN